MIRIITDSAADYTVEQAKNNNIEVVDLSISFNETEYYSNQDDASFSNFYNILSKSSVLPKTSQPAPGVYVSLFEQAKANNDDVLVICLSGGLSGTYQSAIMAKEIVEYSNIHVVDSRQAIMAQRLIVDYAVKLRDEGNSINHIIEKLEYIKDKIVVFGIVETLKYLHLGGRLSKSAMIVGELLTVKPIITLKDGAVIMESKKRGSKNAMNYIQNKLVDLGYDNEYPVYFGYSANKERGQEFMNKTVEKYQIKEYKGTFGIGGTIGAHVGPNGIALAFVVKEKM